MSSKYIKEIRKYAKGDRIELPDRKIKKFSNATAGNYINAIFEIMEDRLRSKKIDTTIDFYKDGIEIIKKISKMYEINKEYVEKRLNSFISLLNATNINTKSKDEEKEEINNAIAKLDEDVIKATQEIYEIEKEEKEEFALIVEIIENSDNIIRKRERILNVLNERPDLINSKNNNGESVTGLLALEVIIAKIVGIFATTLLLWLCVSIGKSFKKAGGAVAMILFIVICILLLAESFTGHLVRQVIVGGIKDREGIQWSELDCHIYATASILKNAVLTVTYYLLSYRIVGAELKRKGRLL